VVAQEDEGMKGHAIEGLGLADDAEDDVGELRGGPQQEAALDGTGGDLYEGVVRNEAERSRHAKLSAKGLSSCLSPPENSGTSERHLRAQVSGGVGSIDPC
jgi:hypothetical protein